MGGPYTVKVINTLCVQEKERKKSDLCSSCRTEKTSTNHANSARKSKNQLDSFRSVLHPPPPTPTYCARPRCSPLVLMCHCCQKTCLSSCWGPGGKKTKTKKKKK